MNLERLRWGEWIAALAGANLLLVTFRAWYKLSGGEGRVTAWDGLESGRYLLIATAALGLLLLLLVAAEQTEQLSFPPGALVAVLGLACTGYVAYRLATPPDDALEADIGLYLGLASALGVAIGGLVSARDANAAPAYTPRATETAGTAAPPPGGGATGPGTGSGASSWSPAPPAATTGWSPAAPAAPSSGWSPAAPAAPVPPATPAGAGFGGAERPLQSGDTVTLTAGSVRFPAGTQARVVEVFAGGALVEVVAADGVAERFEVPEDAFERGAGGAGSPAGSGNPAGAADTWSPAMPSAAGQDRADDWGFDESAGAGAAGAGMAGASAIGREPESQTAEKVPFWKREIGGKKKGKDGAGAAADAGAAAALAAVPEAAGAEQKPGFFKRIFGGDKGAEPTSEAQPAPEADAAPVADEAQPTSELQGAPPEAAAAQPESPAAPAEPQAVAAEPAAPGLAEPEPAPPEPEPEPAPPEPEPAATEPEPAATEPEPEPAATEPEPSPPEPEPAAPEPEPEPAPPEPEPEPTPAADVAGVGPTAESDSAVDEGAAAVSEEPAEEKPKPKRKRSSATRKVPKEAVEAAGGGDPVTPKVGDEVELKVGGGKYDAGTRGKVVDVFSAGVIVELSDDSGRTERLDLPFEAVGPAE